ncbi:UNVERIFIED_CONTAM: hypothetical protein Sradi_2288200 [Sesamum radiatum]|uniref:Uncharacterized protein n=1 Tax=Sesamum radiatum TaxID=300843 RepID=A0AAW2T411_SESRA
MKKGSKSVSWAVAAAVVGGGEILLFFRKVADFAGTVLETVVLGGAFLSALFLLFFLCLYMSEVDVTWFCF